MITKLVKFLSREVKNLNVLAVVFNNIICYPLSSAWACFEYLNVRVLETHFKLLRDYHEKVLIVL